MESLVRSHASRLETLDLATEGDFLSPLTLISFPLLRDLALCSFGPLLKFLVTIVPVFSDVPLLRSLSVENIAPSTLTVPWSQLTSFKATGITLRECLGVLRLATALQEFHRFCSPEDEYDEFDGEPLPLCHSGLTSLIVEANDHLDHDILEFLTIPNLQKMHLGSKFGAWTNDLDTIVLQFLSQTSPAFRSFTIGMSPAIPIRWLQITTHLTTLELIRPKFAAAIISGLDRRSTPDFLPKLQELTISEYDSNRADSQLLKVLNSRSADFTVNKIAFARIQTFRLIWPTYLTGPPPQRPFLHIAALRPLASRGMHIHIGTRDHNTFC
jgi:hypothetical protein